MQRRASKLTLGELYPKLLPLLAREKLVAFLADVFPQEHNRESDTFAVCDFRFRIPRRLGSMRMESFAAVALVVATLLEEQGAIKPMVDGQSNELDVLHWMIAS